MRQWLRGRVPYPTYVLWQGWIVTGGLAAFFLCAAVPGIVPGAGLGRGEVFWALPIAVTAAVMVAPGALLLLFGIRQARRGMKQTLASHA